MAKDFITDAEMQQLEQSGHVQSAPDFIPDSEAGNYGLNRYVPPDMPTPAPQQNEQPKMFKYDVPPEPSKEDRAAKLKRLQAEADAAAAEAKKQGSAWGIFKNTVKGVGETIAAPEIALGKTIGSIIGTNMTADDFQKANQSLFDTNLKTMKMIQQMEKEGKDATKLKRIYNSNVDAIEANNKSFEEISGKAMNVTPLQLAGEIGGTALDVLTAGTYGNAAKGMKSFQLASKANPLVKTAARVVAPEVTKIGEMAAKPTGLFTAKGAANVLKGGAIGYGYDVSSNAQQGKTGTELFKPGLTTLVGFGLPLLTESVRSVQNRTSKTVTVENRVNALKKVEESRAGIRNYVSKQQARGFDPARDISMTDLLKGTVDKEGTIRTKQPGGPVSIYQDFIKPQEAVVSEALKREGNTVSLAQVQKQLEDAVNASGMKGASRTEALAKVRREIAGYRLDALPDGTIPVAAIHDAKVDKYANVDYLKEGGRTDKTIAKTLKEIVEQNTKSVEVKALNNELSRHYANIGYLERLDGAKVEGGRLGKHFARVIGGMVGAHFGPLGTIVGAELAGGVKGAEMSRTFSGKTGRTLEMSDLMKSTIEKNAAEAGQSSKSLGARNMSQSTQMTATTKSGIVKPLVPSKVNKVKGRGGSSRIIRKK